MTSSRLLSLAAAAALCFPGVAAAKGGDKSPAPAPPATAPAPAPSLSCDPAAADPRDVGNGVTTFGMDVRYFIDVDESVGCLILSVDGARVRFVSAEVLPGYTWAVISDAHFADGVVVRFTRTATGARVDYRVQPGKTVIQAGKK